MNSQRRGRMDMESFRKAAINSLKGTLAGWEIKPGGRRNEIECVSPEAVADEKQGYVARLRMDNFHRKYRIGGDLVGVLNQMCETIREQAQANTDGRAFEKWPAAKASLRVQLNGKIEMADEALAAAPKNALISRDGLFGLTEYMVVDQPNMILRVCQHHIDGWLASGSPAVEELWEIAREQTVMALAEATPVVRQYGPVTLTFYDWSCDAQAYTGTRLLFPAMIGPYPTGDERLFVIAPDRDFVVTARCNVKYAPGALDLLWQAQQARGVQPYELLRDFPLAMTPSGRLMPVKFRMPDVGIIIAAR